MTGEFHATPAIRSRRAELEGARSSPRRNAPSFCRARRSCARNRRPIGNYIVERTAAIGDPRLRALCEAFLSEHGERFRRTAGARTYHHARRGGLVEHTAQMMRVAAAIAPLYPQLNLDLLIAGVLVSRFRQALGKSSAGDRIHAWDTTSAAN